MLLSVTHCHCNVKLFTNKKRERIEKERVQGE